MGQAPLAAVNDGGFAQAAVAFPTGSNSRWPADGGVRTVWIWTVCGFLVLAVGLVFGQTLGHEFIGYDDDGFVFKNPHVTPGLTLSGLWYALSDGPFGDWYPLTTLSHMLDCQLYGLNPAGHYLTNVLLHAASSVLLFLVLLRMTGDFWPSAWVAAVFAIHPLHVESVAWLAERRDVLSGLFFMLTLGAYTLYVERPSLLRYLAVAGCLALGLMSKSILVTVPLVLLLLDYWPLGRFRSAAAARPRAVSGPWLDRLPIGWRLVVEKIPLLALSAASCGIVMSSSEPFRLANDGEFLSLGPRVANALVSCAAYLAQSFFPVNLSPFYPNLGTHLPIAWAAGSLIPLVAITAVAAYCWRRLPCLLVGWLWFLGMLVPVLGLVGGFLQARGDRYTYLSQIGLSIALAWSVWSIYRSRQFLHAARWRERTLAVVSGGAVLLLAVVAWRQTSYWRNAETVWTRALACTEQNTMAHYGLANVYARQGRDEEATAHLREALATYSISRFLTAESHDLLAAQLTKEGKTDEAIEHLEQAVHIFPKDERMHYHLAAALARAGKHDRAIVEWRETLRLCPADLHRRNSEMAEAVSAHARIGLADALLALGETSEAIVQCREVLKSYPLATEAIVILGEALAAEGHLDEALPNLEHAVAIEPKNARAQFHLGLVLYECGQSQTALAHLNEAVQLQPDDVPMLWQTAWILATSPDRTVRDGERAVELGARATQMSDSQEPRTLDTLAAALAEIGQFSAAIALAEQASTMALARGDTPLADAIEQRTRLYRQSLPYRSPAAQRAGRAGVAGSGRVNGSVRRA